MTYEHFGHSPCINIIFRYNRRSDRDCSRTQLYKKKIWMPMLMLFEMVS